jgi:CheY-like chemotaxis protein
MAVPNRILLLDDDEQMLDLYQELLKQLPSAPEVHTCNAGARAIAMLESQPYTLLITDLRMPKMDGLQVLAIVRRKFPQLRIIVLTGIMDEEYRSRAYAQGVELFWQKPGSGEEIKLFQDCIESLLGREVQETGGFRGVQRKSLVDLIQLECLSRSSSVLRINQGSMEGKIWVQNGDIIDAASGNLNGEEAFREILSWKGGNFEILPAEPNRTRTIYNSYQGLLLDTAQALDEQQGALAATDNKGPQAVVSGLAALGRNEGVEYVLAVPPDDKAPIDAWSLDNSQPVAQWMRDTDARLRRLGDELGCGELIAISAFGLQGHFSLAAHPQKGLLGVGFRRAFSSDEVQQTMKQIFAKWAS